jgi:hypothetical protein
MENSCWFCARPLTQEDKKRANKPNKYLDKDGTPPCEACYNHMVEVDLRPDEWRDDGKV